VNRKESRSPYFSIVIPVYNRAEFVGRTLKSCLSQSFDDFEVIVVDDASTDDSVQVARAFNDPRLRLICHATNRGVGPARNTGADNALGEWIVPLDSDDELLPDALKRMYGRAKESGVDIDRLQFMVQGDDGRFSPDPPLKDEVWEYKDYIRWLERSSGRPSETLPIARRRTFNQVRYADDRTLEGPYHLDFMSRFKARTCPDVVRLYHHDAANQLSIPTFARLLRDTPSQSLSIERMLAAHGTALGQLAPRCYVAQLSLAAALHFLAGKKLKGLKYSAAFLQSNLLSVHTWLVLMAGLFGPRPLASLVIMRAAVRAALSRKKSCARRMSKANGRHSST